MCHGEALRMSLSHHKSSGLRGAGCAAAASDLFVAPPPPKYAFGAERRHRKFWVHAGVNRWRL